MSTTATATVDLNDIQLGWLAGLFEGEGYISLHSSGACIGINMTDRDVIEMVNHVWPSPSGVKSYAGQNGHKEQYRWRLTSRRAARAFLDTMLPLFGVRRSTRAREAIEHIDALERIRRTW